MSTALTAIPAGTVAVRRVQTPETPTGRIIIPESVREGWTLGQYEVVIVGAPARCEDDWCERTHVAECHPCDLKPGQWVFAATKGGVVELAGDLVLIRQDDVWAVLTY